MRTFFLIILLATSPACLLAQNTNPYPTGTQVNYIRTWDATAPEQDGNVLVNRPLKDVKQATQYFDGLGRPVQTVMKQGSLETGSLPADFVSPVVYDEFGREQYKYLPFAANTTGGNTSVSDGLFKLNPFQQQQAFMTAQYGAQGENTFFSKTNFEASPLGRPEKAMAAGNSWAGSNRGVEMKYWSNTSVDEVKIWDVSVSAGPGAFGNCFINTVYGGGTYPAGQLFKNVSVDEHGKQVIEFKDKEGKVVLKKVQLTATADDGTGKDHGGWLCTYYIYDDIGNLRCVIQPEGVKWLAVNGWALPPSGGAGGGSVVAEQCFRYEYDARNRMIMKKVPGAGEVYMVYDRRDRLVMTQDANLRNLGRWTVTKYDELNRPVETGLWTNAISFATHLSSAYNSSAYPATTSGYEELSKTFYDDYSWLSSYGSPLPATYNSSYNTYFQPASNTAWPYAQANVQTAQLKGMVTGSRIKVLGSATYLYAISFYDEKARVIQVQGTNITGGTDIMTTQYTWAGQPLVMVQKQQKSGGTAQEHIVVTKMEYDDMGRVLNVKKTVNSTIGGSTVNKPEQLILANKYDKLGQLKEKQLGAGSGTPLWGAGGLLNYEYNIRGWMLGMNRDYVRDAPPSGVGGPYFGFDLGYDKASNNLIGGQIYANPQYNGNIEGMVWKSKGDGEKRKYDFYYDAANRLLRGDFKQYTGGAFNQNAGVNYDMKMGDGANVGTAYDANGNILQMQQWGLKVTGSVQIDNLNYQYISGSNKLQSVTELTLGSTDNKLGDFTDKNTANDDYNYDVNGNLNVDKNKSISSITYNYLNLPSVITVTGKGTISYTYDAGGNKIQKTTTDNTVTPAKITTTLYLGGAVYENDVLQFLGQEEGRIRFKQAAGSIPASLQYDYMLKDHLGNVRMVLTEEQQQDKYPVASLEDAKLSTEQQYYTINTGKIVAANTVTGLPVYTNDNGIGNNPADAAFSASNSQKLYKINGNDTSKTGLGITLKVMAGDRVDIFGKSYYFQAGSGTSTTTQNAMVLEILNGLLGGPTGGAASAAHGGVTATQLNALPATTGGIYNILSQQASGTPADPPPPLAFINYMFFDEQFKFVEGGFSRVGTQNQLKDHFSDLQNKVAQKNGYVYIYVSNETAVNVFFDNLQVVHTRGPILEETHYYPFGLTMAGISSKALAFGGAENKQKFNKGSELQNKEFSDGSGLEWYATQFRSLDPQLGRWWQIDPKPNIMESPYAAMGNNPILKNDPLGDTVRFDKSASKEFIQKYNQARELLKDKKLDKNISRLEKSKGVYVIKEGKFESFNATFQSNRKEGKGGVITWCPTMGMKLKSGASLSPLAILNHEFDHGAQFDRNPKQFNSDNMTPDAQYSDLEEKRAIVGDEQNTARKLEELNGAQQTRTSHHSAEVNYVYHASEVTSKDGGASLVEYFIRNGIKF